MDLALILFVAAVAALEGWLIYLLDLAAATERSLSAEVRYLLRRYTEEPESFA